MECRNNLGSELLASRKVSKRSEFAFPKEVHHNANSYYDRTINRLGKNHGPEIIPFAMSLDRVMRDDIWNIKKSLEAEGFKLYIAGGAVRDYVDLYSNHLKIPLQSDVNKPLNNVHIGKFCPKDFDLVTDAKPHKMNTIFEKAGYITSMSNIGDSFGVKILQTRAKNTFELAALRKDIGGGRNPDTINFESNLFEDAKRRDLSINAMYYEIKGKSANGFTGDLIDYFGGIEDIKNKVIRPTGGMTEKFHEDPLRKIRALRFAARLGFRIPEISAKAIMRDKTSIVDPNGKRITNEHLHDEFYKGIKYVNSTKYFLQLLNDFDFYKHIFGDLKINKQSFVNEPNPMVIIGSLLKNNESKQVEKELFKHNFSRSEISSITFLIRLKDLNENNVSELKRIFLQNVICDLPIINGKKCVVSPQAMKRFAEISNIDKTRVDNFVRLINELTHPSKIISQMGIPPSKEMGKTIMKLEREFFKDPQKVLYILDRKDTISLKKLLNL